MIKACLALVAFWLFVPGVQAQAREELLVATAANFAEALQVLEPDFERESGVDLVIVSGSTGQLYAQIRAGAPFEVFLSADQARPAQLEAEGLIQAGSRFTYAVGQLSLWSPDPDLITGPEALYAAGYIAIANPDLAPYGAAAAQVLAGLDVDVSARLAMGQNVGQAFAMIATGSAKMGFVARSAVLSPRNVTKGSRWDVPENLHDPILQDAVALRDSGPLAMQFLTFLRSDLAQRKIAALGYGVQDD